MNLPLLAFHQTNFQLSKIVQIFLPSVASTHHPIATIVSGAYTFCSIVSYQESGLRSVRAFLIFVSRESATPRQGPTAVYINLEVLLPEYFRPMVKRNSIQLSFEDQQIPKPKNLKRKAGVKWRWWCFV